MHEVTSALAVEMLLVTGAAADREDAATHVEQALASGRAAEIFARMVQELGGPADLLENAGHLPSAPVIKPCIPPEGTLLAVDTRAVGVAVIGLGGGRSRAGDPIDYSVGLTEVAALGEAVGPERPLALVHARSAHEADRAIDALLDAASVGSGDAQAQPTIKERLS